MADLTHLFKVGQSVKYKNDDFDSDPVNKFIPCAVKETYPNHIIITDIETNTDMWCEEEFNMDRVFPEYEYIHNLSGLARALTYIDIERLDMGDSHEELDRYIQNLNNENVCSNDHCVKMLVSAMRRRKGG